jgi:hypothetical protein
MATLVKSMTSIFEVIKETAKTYTLVEKIGYNQKPFRAKKQAYSKFELIPLTNENAANVLTIIKITNMEWGVKPFHYKAQKLTGDRFTHIIGRGGNSSILNENEFKFWAVVSFK